MKILRMIIFWFIHCLKKPKAELQDLQWPMNSYAKWFHENPGSFYLAEKELKKLELEMGKDESDIKLDIDGIKSMLVE